MKKATFLLLLPLWLSSGLLAQNAQEAENAQNAQEAQDEETIASRAPGPERYRNLWANSPFLRPLNAAESFALTGVVRFDGKPMVTMLNTATGERITLTTSSNPQGWRLIDLSDDPNPRNVVARVVVNGEEVAVRFSERQFNADALVKAASGPGRPMPLPTPKARVVAPKEPAPRKEALAKPKALDSDKKKRQNR